MSNEEAMKELSYIIDEMPSMECADWIEAISMGIKALNQEPSRDIEEIEEIINCDANAEIKLKMISNIVYSKPHYFKVLEKEPCEDCVSRRAVLYAIANDKLDYAALYEYTKQLPPVTPTEETAHWISIGDFECYCSNCHCWCYKRNKTRYCSYCGAKMEVEK